MANRGIDAGRWVTDRRCRRVRDVGWGLLLAMGSVGCVTIPESDPTPPKVTLEVTMKLGNAGTPQHFKVDSDAPLQAAFDTQQLVDFESLHAVGTAYDTGGVFAIEVHAEIDQPCGAPAGGFVVNTPSRQDSDVAKAPGDTASRSRLTYLDVKKPQDFPVCPSGSPAEGAVHVRVWAVGTNFHGGVTTSPSLTLMLLR